MAIVKRAVASANAVTEPQKVEAVKTEAVKSEPEKKAAKKPAAAKKPVAAKKPAAAKKPVAAKKSAAAKKPVAAKKPAAAKKPVAAKKPAAAKKVSADARLFIQFDGREVSKSDIEKQFDKIWKENLGKKADEIKNATLYVKPEEAAVYYVVNDDITGKFDI